MISYCMLYAKEYYINDSSWSYYNPVKKNCFFFRKKHMLFKRKYDIIEEDNFIYLLLLKEFKFKGQISPFSVEKIKSNL